jgi:cyclopropane-fatty-acyl-phospholipid synthase
MAHATSDSDLSRTYPKRPAASLTAAGRLSRILSSADIQVNGSRPWDIQVHDDRFWWRVLSGGSLALGESYMDGWWDVERLDEFFAKVNDAGLDRKAGGFATLLLWLKGTLFNLQTRSRSAGAVRSHYDLGAGLFEKMLGREMQYSCAYWTGAGTLDQAQRNKMQLIARKLRLAPGMCVLDLGGGFGGLARHLAEEHGCRVVSYNVSRDQVAYARELCRGLPVRVEERDYREARGEPERFDRIVSVGFLEHVGHKNYRPLMDLARRLLRDAGLFLLQTIGGNRSVASVDPWIDRYIFPNGLIPSIAQLGRAMEDLWVVEDWHNFGPDYDRTLVAWWRNFERAWPELRAKYDERFRRMWNYYLLSCAGAFRARKLQLWQIVLSKGDIPSYMPAR